MLPEWAAKLLDLQKVNITVTKLGEPQAPWSSVGSFGAKVGLVCEAVCNNGWMSDLETIATPALSRMILPTGPVTLNIDEQVVIASWLWKLAIVHEKPSGALYFNKAERMCLIDGDAPTPFGVHMWIAAYIGPLDANLRGGPCEFGSPHGHKLHGYLMTMSIRRFAAQLLCVRELPGVDVSTVSHYNFEGAEALIWPEQDGPVTWPPPVAGLDHDLFNKWYMRWNTPTK